ncbi:hypothetical protein CWB73_07715 [Pseudoalteromonas phenolica]|uniref:Lipoprotein n=1 Tax=Pseudoalteromonas phenolica TaxID=161398 RepID=A0A5S3YVC2_9GAMM|nr:hypothetical protein [Pseudoalteromonas phenolica]TMP81461.1 hypothetical protein CWB73_07715 [Pseudoalteromonas phenolica]
MRKYLLTPLAAALTLTLTACGGGSSGEDTPEKGPGSGGGSVTTLPTLQPMSLYAYSYQCNEIVPHQAEVVFHDDQGRPLGNSKTDSQGEFAGELPEDTKHISVISQIDDPVDGAYTKIHTELDIEHRTNLGGFFFDVNTNNCRCELFSLDTTDFTYTQNGYQLYESAFPLSNNKVEVCPFEDKVYLRVVSNNQQEAKAAVLDLTDEIKSSKTIKLSDAQFQHQGVLVENKQSLNSDLLSTRAYDKELHKYQFVGFTNSSDNNALFVFPSVFEDNFYTQSGSETMSPNGLEISFSTHARSKVNAEGEYDLTELPQVSANLGADLLNFTNSQDFSYDFSANDERFARAQWEYSFLVDDTAETRFDWRIEGSISGQIPDLSFGDVFQEPTDPVTLESLSIFLYGYAGNSTDHKSFSELLDKHNQIKGRLTKPEFSNYVYTRVHANFD